MRVYDLKPKPIHPQQNIMEMSRVRIAHHCKPKMNGFFLQITPFWCAQRTLRRPLSMRVYLKKPIHPQISQIEQIKSLRHSKSISFVSAGDKTQIFTTEDTENTEINRQELRAEGKEQGLRTIGSLLLLSALANSFSVASHDFVPSSVASLHFIAFSVVTMLFEFYHLLRKPVDKTFFSSRGQPC